MVRNTEPTVFVFSNSFVSSFKNASLSRSTIIVDYKEEEEEEEEQESLSIEKEGSP